MDALVPTIPRSAALVVVESTRGVIERRAFSDFLIVTSYDIDTDKEKIKEYQIVDG